MSRNEGGIPWQIVAAIIGFVFLCVVPWIVSSWSTWFPPPLNHDDYMNGKSIIAWRETMKRQIPDPYGGKDLVDAVFTKIHFVASGKTFPEGEYQDMIISTSPICGKVDGVMDLFKVYDANPGGIMRWSYRGYIPMGDYECPYGETVPYPGYNPDLDPDGFTERLGLFQDCWLSVWGPSGLQEKMRCGQSSYVGYANIKGVAPAGNSSDVFHFIVMSDDGISAIPFSKLQEVMRSSGIEISTDQFFNLITQINGDPENPAYAPIWETWRWK